MDTIAGLDRRIKEGDQAMVNFATIVQNKIEDMAQVLHDQSADIIAQGIEIRELRDRVAVLEGQLPHIA